uniref:Serpin domain-containing protein n=1 Tax=Monodelphis domestica TaxID=13616 RepID=F7G5W4_MONDO
MYVELLLCAKHPAATPCVSHASPCAIGQGSIMDILSEGDAMFAITLLKKLCKENISFALNMIFLETKRETSAQIAKLLSLNRNGDIYLGFQSLLTEMNKPSTWYLLKTTNKIFGENALNFLMSFRDSCFKFCNSVMEDVCFSQEAEAVRKHINAWVAEKTAVGNILEALPDGLVNPLSLLVLVNAINFKATWKEAFDPRHTYTNLVKVNQYERKTLPIMKKREEFLTTPLEELGAQLFIFPYHGMELTMILMFTSDSDLTKLEQGLTYERFITWTKHFFLPKIKIEETSDLEYVLNSLGMSDAFDENKADFSRMSMLKTLYLSKVLHTSYLEINEEGINASAATIAAQIPTNTKRNKGLKTNG